MDAPAAGCLLARNFVKSLSKVASLPSSITQRQLAFIQSLTNASPFLSQQKRSRLIAPSPKTRKCSINIDSKTSDYGYFCFLKAGVICLSRMYFMSKAVATAWETGVGSLARKSVKSSAICAEICSKVALSTFLASSALRSSASSASLVSNFLIWVLHLSSCASTLTRKLDHNKQVANNRHQPLDINSSHYCRCQLICQQRTSHPT